MLPMLLLARTSRILSCCTAILMPSIYRHARIVQLTRNFTISSVVSAAAAKSTAEKPKRISAAKKTKTKRVTSKKKASTKKKKRVVKKEKIVLGGRPELKPPKRPPPPYLLFFTHRLKANKCPEGMNGRLFVINLTKETTTLWKSLSEQEKQTFNDEYAAALVEYEKQMEEYVKNTDPAVIKEINRRRSRSKRQRRHMISRPHGRTNAFIEYCTEQRATRSSPTSKEQAKELLREFGKSWTALTDAEKDIYRQRASTKNAAGGDCSRFKFHMALSQEEDL